MTTPLAPPDETAAEALWARYLASVGEPPGARWTDLVQFGDSRELSAELLELVLHGPKRATAGSVAEYEAEGVPLPVVGDRWIAVDGHGRPRAVARTTQVRVGPVSSVDDAFAWDEGEGDRTRADWLRAMSRISGASCPPWGSSTPTTCPWSSSASSSCTSRTDRGPLDE